MLPPAAWKVPTSGAVLNRMAVWVGPGQSGSCRCTTSKASSRRARMVRSWADTSGVMGATGYRSDVRIGIVQRYSITLPGGVQGQVLGLAHELRLRGHEVRVLGPCDGPSATPRSSAC